MERSDFAAFFAALNDGCGPFRWQERLLDSLLENGRWPERIAAPTSAGKTSAIDVHVFAVALTADGCGPRLPRRLAMVVDRRVLVDDQYQRARAVAAELADPSYDVVAEAAARLASLRWPKGDAEERHPGRGRGQSPLVTGRLRGGALPARSWRDVAPLLVLASVLLARRPLQEVAFARTQLGQSLSTRRAPNC